MPEQNPLSPVQQARLTQKLHQRRTIVAISILILSVIAIVSWNMVRDNSQTSDQVTIPRSPGIHTSSGLTITESDRSVIVSRIESVTPSQVLSAVRELDSSNPQSSGQAIALLIGQLGCSPQEEVILSTYLQRRLNLKSIKAIAEMIKKMTPTQFQLSFPVYRNMALAWVNKDLGKSTTP